MQRLLKWGWRLYQIGVALGVGWFALILSIFATDSPNSSIWAAALFGVSIFVIGWMLLVMLPAWLFRFFFK